MTTPTRQKVTKLLRAHRHDCPSCFERLTSLVRHSKAVTLQRGEPQDRTHAAPLWMKVHHPAASQRLCDFWGLPHNLNGHAATQCPSCQQVWHWSWRSRHKKEGTLTLHKKASPSLAQLLAQTQARKADTPTKSKPNPKRYTTTQRTKPSQPQQEWPVDPRDSPPFQRKITPQAVIERNRAARAPLTSQAVMERNGAASAQERAMEARERQARERFSAKARALGTTPQTSSATPDRPTSSPNNRIRDVLVRYAGRFFTAPYEPMCRWETLPEYMPAEKTWSLEELEQKHDFQSDTLIYWVSWQNDHWNEASFGDVHTHIKCHHFKGYQDRNVLMLETTWAGLIAIPQMMRRHSQEIVLILPKANAGYLIAG